jgi:CHAD domain-containing protein
MFMPYQVPAGNPSDQEPRAATEGDGPVMLQTLTLPRVKPRDPAGHALLTSLESALLRIQSSEWDALCGEGEGIHRLRTSTRRLRSDLRAFRDMVEPHWAEEIEGELKWFTGLLGEVRDVDVLSRRIKRALSLQDDSDTEAMAPMFEELTARHARTLRALRNALQGDRYRNLVASLQHAIEHPALMDEAHSPCRTVIPPLAKAAWRRLKKPAKELRPTDPDEQFHEVRKRAKRARYNAEMIAEILGRSAAKCARRFIRRVTRLQDTLGEHQDAIITAREIDDALALHPDDAAFVRAGRHLLEGQHAAAQDARDEFFRAWDKLDRKELRRWMKSSSMVKS